MSAETFVRELEASNQELLAIAAELRSAAARKIGARCFPGC